MPSELRRRAREARIRLMSATRSPTVRRDTKPDQSVITENAQWVAALSGSGPVFEDAVSVLYVTLVKMGYSEARWRAGALRLSGQEVDDIAHQAAADAVIVICRKLANFRGECRFTTWAYQFVAFDVRSKVNRHMWRPATLAVLDDGRDALPHARDCPDNFIVAQDLKAAVYRLLRDALTSKQRAVFEAIVINGVPVSQVARDFGSNRNALYKTVFDARRKLREGLRAEGYLND